MITAGRCSTMFKKKSLSLKEKGCILLTLTLVVTIVIYTFLHFDNKSYQEKFYPGVLVNDIDISGMTQREAREKLSRILNNDSSTFILNGFENQWEVNKKDFVVYDITTMLEKIQSNQSRNNVFRAFTVRFNQKRAPKNYSIPFILQDNFKKKLLDIKAETDIKPTNAQFSITSLNSIEIIPHQNGKAVDVEETLYQVIRSIESNLSSSYIIYKEYEPDILTSDLEKLNVNDLLFSVESNFYGTGENRIYNIKLAASKITIHLLLPGEEFSFNGVVGPASKSNGFKEATVIRNGQFVPGYGGGVCQVSSNLYLGALKANLEIIERINHSRPVSYLPRGLDATIGYPRVDLRFRNNTPYGIIINTRTSNSTIIIDFYSYKPHFPSSVKFEHSEEVIPFMTEYKDNPKLKKGDRNIVQRGALGYKVVTYRIMTINGNTTRELISTDTYWPLKEIIEVGSMPVNSDESKDDDGEMGGGNSSND